MSEHDPLLEELRRIAAAVDPMPEALVQAGRDSLTWLSVDAELAELLSDSAVDDERLAGVRSVAGVRAVSFASTGTTIELDILDAGEERTLVGQLVPGRRTAIEIQTPTRRAAVMADEHGRFRAEQVPAGQLRLRIPSNPGGDRALETSWITV